MADIQFYPPGYQQYLATQRRVSDWVKDTHSLAKLSAKARRPASKRSASADTMPTAQFLPWKRPKLSKRRSSARRRHSLEMVQPSPITPAVALVSSSLLVCALLPSILTISAFVVLLTIASMDKGVSRFSDVVTVCTRRLTWLCLRRKMSGRVNSNLGRKTKCLFNSRPLPFFFRTYLNFMVLEAWKSSTAQKVFQNLYH